MTELVDKAVRETRDEERAEPTSDWVKHDIEDGTYTYETCCTSIPSDKVDALDAMIENAVDSTLEQMRQHCEGIDEWAVEHHYALDPNESLTLEDDWHVSYHYSIFDSRPCFYLVWSAIEFIWTKDPEA